MKNKYRSCCLLLSLLGVNILSAHAQSDSCQDIYFSPDDPNHEKPLAKPHLKLSKSLKLAKAGNAVEQMNMAVSFDTGHLVAACPEKALYWYKKAADKGNRNAQKWLARHMAEPPLQAALDTTKIESPATVVLQELAASEHAPLSADDQNDASIQTAAPPSEGEKTEELASDKEQIERISDNKSLDSGDPLVRIDRFEIVGNTLLDKEAINEILEPFKGEKRSFTDIQRALEAIEGAYRSAGYSAVHVTTPEQDVTEGVVVFIVTESAIGKVTLHGNEYYDLENIRNALPALIENTIPNAHKLSENIRLANENPTRQIDVVLAMSDKEGRVDAKVNVKDSSPHKFFVTLDNTGNESTGMYRTGAGYQHNNLFNRDHAATFNYVTSPGHISSVTQLSASYRLPLYSLGDSIDLILAHSDTNAGTSPIVGGFLLTFSGKGNIYGVHYNHYFPRQGDYASKFIAGFDYRSYFNNCQINGQAICGAGGNNLTVHPISLTYSGTLTKPTYIADHSISFIRNFSGGPNGGSSDFSAARAAGARADYKLLRFNGSVLGALPADWQYRLAGSLQYTHDALVTYENIGLVGANTVRGFIEREISNDKGIVLNLELYTPELAKQAEDGSFKLLGFIDRAHGWKVPLPGEVSSYDSLGSIGLGFRYAYGKSISARFDLAKVTGAGNSINTRNGDHRGQISVIAYW